MFAVSIILSLLIIVLMALAGLQNRSPLQVDFAWMTLQMSVSAVVFWAGIGGAAVVALLSLPRLSRKAVQARALRKEIQRLEKLCCAESSESDNA
jgi:uncharacterized integral membrane protein